MTRKYWTLWEPDAQMPCEASRAKTLRMSLVRIFCLEKTCKNHKNAPVINGAFFS